VRLQKFQKNAIFKAVAAGGLDMNECRLDEVGDEARIHHLPSKSLFVLNGPDAGLYRGSYVVGENELVWPIEASWASVPEKVQRWATEVKEDVDTPDLWAELQRDQDIITVADFEAVENTPFTPDEQTEIATRLREIKAYVKTNYALSAEQMAHLDARFDHAEAASRRMGRKDWVVFFYGVGCTTIVQGLLPPEGLRHILTIAFRGVNDLLGGWGKPQLPSI
jgi:hypothetical protein